MCKPATDEDRKRIRDFVEMYPDESIGSYDALSLLARIDELEAERDKYQQELILEASLHGAKINDRDSWKQRAERAEKENDTFKALCLSLRDAVNEYHRTKEQSAADEVERLAGMCNKPNLLKMPYVNEIVQRAERAEQALAEMTKAMQDLSSG